MLAELASRAGVGDAPLQAVLHLPDVDHEGAEDLPLHHVVEHQEPRAHRPDHLRPRHPDVVQEEFAQRRAAQAHLGDRPAHRQAGRVPLHQEGGEPGRVAPVAGPGVDHDQVGDRTVADEGLGAVQHEVVAVRDGGGPHPHHVGSAVRLGDGVRADRAAVHDARQEAALELLGAEALQRYAGADQMGGGREVQPGVPAAVAEALQDVHRGQQGLPEAAVLLGERQPGQPRVAQPLPAVPGEARRGVPLQVAVADHRPQFGDRRPQGLLVVIPLHRCPRVGSGRKWSGSGRASVVREALAVELVLLVAVQRRVEDADQFEVLVR